MRVDVRRLNILACRREPCCTPVYMVTILVQIRTILRLEAPSRVHPRGPMKPLKVSEDVLPIADFKARASEVARQLRRNRRPMIVTQNGKPAMVLLAPEDYDRLTYRTRFVEAVDEGLADTSAGRVVTDAVLRKALDARLGKLGR